MAEVLGLEAVRLALAEDWARQDITTGLFGLEAERRATGCIVAEDSFVVAGLQIAALVFHELDRNVSIDTLIADGSWAETDATIAAVGGSARTLLAGERVALNFVQRLSGIATLTRRAVEAVAGTNARITHTRKTTPGLRRLEQYAVRVGGGVDNRASLAEAVLWKDNHWALAAGRGRRLARLLSGAPPGVSIMVEVETEEQLEVVLEAGVKHILADNQPPERVATWVRRAGPGVTLQASGGISLDTVRAYALAGATLISIGALTHSAPAVSLRFDVSSGPGIGS